MRIEKQLMVEAIKITDERFGLSQSGQRLFGLLPLTMSGFGQMDYDDADNDQSQQFPFD